MSGYAVQLHGASTVVEVEGHKDIANMMRDAATIMDSLETLVRLSSRAAEIKAGLEAVTGMTAEILTAKMVYGSKERLIPISAGDIGADKPVQVVLRTPTNLTLCVVHLFIVSELDDPRWEQGDGGDVSCLERHYDDWKATQ